MNILMPQLGETVAEGKITVWYKSVGDAVAAGDSLFEIETDKTSMDVPTSEAGVLSEIRVAAGATVPVGAVVAVLSAAQAAGQSPQVAQSSPAAPSPQAAQTAQPAPAGNGAQRKAGGVAAGAAASAPAAASTAAAPAARPLDPFHSVRTPERNYGPATLPNGVKVTPAARRIAVESGVDLGALVGSGPHGHIVVKDVQAAAAPSARLAAARPAAAETRAPADTRAAAAPGAASTVTAGQVRAMYANAPFEEIALDGMRRTIARRLAEAKQSVPHFYLNADIALDRLVGVRSELNAQAEGAFKLSINDFVIKAVALALQRVPDANAVWAEDSILRFKQSDVAVAVAVPGGLYTPVIRHAESKSISAVSAEMKALAARAQARALKPDEYQGGSISISNLGMYGVRSFSAIVNPPQAAILAVGAAERRALEAPDGSVRFGSVMSVTLSCDHRVIDGALGGQLLAAVKALLEAPLLLLV